MQTGRVRLAKETESAEEAVALTVKGGSPRILSARAAKLIVWAALAAVVDSVTCEAPGCRLELPGWL